MGTVFLQLLSITVLLCAVQLIASYSFKNCIEKQRGSVFQCISRKDKDLSALLKDLPPTATNLNITHNNLGVIPNNSFDNLTLLQYLRLDDNKLTDICQFAFQSLHQLQYLNLSLNQLSHLNPRVFRNLHNLTSLFLANNNLKQLPEDIFSDLTNLTTLILRHNLLTNFSGIVKAVFHLKSLVVLDLCFNNLTSLSHDNVTLPKTLTKLYLSKNYLHELACDKLFLGSIKILDLSYNANLSTISFHGIDLGQINFLILRSTKVDILEFLNISNVNPANVDYSGVILHPGLLKQLCSALQQKKIKRLKKLRLGDNGIHKLENTTLNDCPIINEYLDLSHNKFNETDCLMFLNKQTKITNLTMEHNYLMSLPSCKTQNVTFFKNLIELNFRYNRILSVMANAFYQTPNLMTLKLNINKLAYLEIKAFKGLKKLVTLRLDNNLITDLLKCFDDLINLNTLNLRNNRIDVIFEDTFQTLEKLTTLDLGGNKITHIKPSGLNGLKSLSKFYLDGNKLKTIENSLSPVFQDTLTVLDLEGNMIEFTYHAASSPFRNFSKLTDLKLSGQKPHGLIVLPHTIFRGLYSLEYLYLTNNNIRFLHPDTFNDLTSLQFLTLDNCCVGVANLHPGVFKNLRNLTKLTVENMGIQNFSKDVFSNLTQLSRLQMNNNALQSISVDALQSLPNLQYIDLRNTPLSCTCDNSLLQSYALQNPTLQVVNLYQLPCPQDKKHNFYNFDVNVCYLDFGKYMFISTVIVVFLFTVTPLLYIKLYWKMKYSYYIFCAWFSEQWSRFREGKENCKYDAFISYNSSDEQWVMDQLLPNLEGNGSTFKLCLHHRDFELGRYIVDNIVSAVYSSRKTVCVVSRNFLQSEWCSLEMQLASYRLFDEHRDVLLLVFLHPISERQLSSYHRMRKVMLKKTYLQWPGMDCTDPAKAQELFWTQLRRAIRTDGRMEREETGLRDETETPENKETKELDYKSDDNYYLFP
ncbi:toll-like receptor 21 [Gouania willdenowi]|uniref:Toll-like receptor 13 n=1 Tax=Gouania willdenowi TaxID=441366 RepID=A0A8C5EDA5_GOUWI|nr:toll-like receptor 13 [Gouania willdenowi]